MDFARTARKKCAELSRKVAGSAFEGEVRLGNLSEAGEMIAAERREYNEGAAWKSKYRYFSPTETLGVNAA
jgi:hypothetical protein